MSADAWLTWSAIAEPGDDAAAWLVDALGPDDALAWAATAARDPVAATVALAPLAPERTVDAAVRASERWSRRRDAGEAARLRVRAERCGARAVWRGHPEWPAALDDLGAHAPYCLWVRGGGDLAQASASAIAVIGARASTAYGDHMAATIAADVGERGWAVVSGGAYGIDAAAHRGALAVGATTVAFMAGGVDRLYPAGNADLLERVLRTGVIASEVPPGWAPHRSRFLSRNRLIACAHATIVVEAARRSGALATARHAAGLARPVGAVPGPVTSASSAGCHVLLRDAVAVLVRDGTDAIALAGPLDAAAEEGAQSDGAGLDFAAPSDRAVYDALGTRSRDPLALAGTAGVTDAELAASLGRLELGGLAVRDGALWRRTAR